MTLNEIELFLNLASTLHFQKASSLSHLSPSAFSRAIKRLESQAGQRLFERNNREVRLTRAGEIFKDHAEKMLRIWQDAHQEMELEQGVIAGELNIYCSVTAAYGILPDILDAFRQQYPGVHIRLRTGDAESALGLLENREVDIAIAAIPEKLPGEIDYLYITSTPLVWICSTNSPPVDTDSTSVGEVPLIIPRQGIARKRFDKWCRTMGITPDIYAQVTGNEAIIAMVHLGCGIGLVPEMVLQNSPVMDRVSVIDINPPLKSYTIGICVNKKMLSNPLTRAFWTSANDFER